MARKIFILYFFPSAGFLGFFAKWHARSFSPTIQSHPAWHFTTDGVGCSIISLGLAILGSLPEDSN